MKCLTTRRESTPLRTSILFHEGKTTPVHPPDTLGGVAVHVQGVCFTWTAGLPTLCYTTMFFLFFSFF